MKRILFLVFLLTLSLTFPIRYSGTPMFYDIPGGFTLNKGQFLFSYDFMLGSTHSPLEPAKDIYYNGNLRLSYTPLDFMQVSFILFSISPFSPTINIDFNVLKEDEGFIPSVFAGIHSVGYQKLISTEGDDVEFDHQPYLSKNNDKLYNYNSLYICVSRSFKGFLLNLGFGAGRFVGFSNWSKRVNIADLISFFGGISYTMQIQSALLSFSLEQDGRDFNMLFTGTFFTGEYSILTYIGATKMEHWLQKTGFQPKFVLGLTLLYK